MRARSFTVDREADELHAALLRAISQRGKVKDEELSPTGGGIVGRIRYGLQRVKVRVHHSNFEPGSSLVDVFSQGDDVWQSAAKKVAKGLQEDLEAAGLRCELVSEEDVTDLFGKG